MKTIFLLLAEYDSAIIPLERVRDKYFSLSKVEAERRAKKHELPIPAFRCGSNKSQWMIRAEDLAAFIDDTAAEQKEIWAKMQRA